MKTLSGKHKATPKELFKELTNQEKHDILLYAMHGSDSFFAADSSGYFDEFIKKIICSKFFAQSPKGERKFIYEMLTEMRQQTANIGKVFHKAGQRAREARTAKEAA